MSPKKHADAASCSEKNGHVEWQFALQDKRTKKIALAESMVYLGGFLASAAGNEMGCQQL